MFIFSLTFYAILEWIYYEGANINFMMHIGLDIGSTTAKVVVTDIHDNILFQTYRRHFSDIQKTIFTIFQEVSEKIPDSECTICVTGSSGLAISEALTLPFVQEVIACTDAVETYIPQTDIVIELGGEDAKIIYFKGGIEQRMNSACAGGTGAFIDQIATLLKTDATGLNELAQKGTTLYPIASRCGVFAKTDVQPLLNEGVNKEDIAMSIYQSVVNQVITGLAAGRPIKGRVAFLGGPLTFSDQLRKRFVETLELAPDEVILPQDAEYFIAIGSALVSKDKAVFQLTDILKKLRLLDLSKLNTDTFTLPILFKDEAEYHDFKARHAKTTAPRGDLATYSGDAYLGIDAGSTTSKLILIGKDKEILYTHYSSNNGNPLQSIIDATATLYEALPDTVRIAHSGITGYGEALIKEGLKIDIGQIETVAHYRAAAEFAPDVDFILDIGGQDMKCMKIRNSALDNIILNEACSAGCGSFLESFAKTLDLSIEAFVEKAIASDEPVDLGSRCTVFMNSKVKQVQKEGCSIENLAAGLAYSVIKNALQKVIKLRNNDELGDKIIVQGGTFYNDAVLRAFELLTEREVVRPDIAGMMGAYGMALLAQEQYEHGELSNLLILEKLQQLSTDTEKAVCGKCNNGCQLTITHFDEGRSFITGNRCERGASLENNIKKNTLPNLYEYKFKRMFSYRSLTPKKAMRGTIGIPRVLNIFENYPLWHTMFTQLGYRVVISDVSSPDIFNKGIATIASEAVCYPAKLAHGHIMNLIEKGVDAIFYPAVVYEKPEYADSDNSFNCPVVAGYPEVIRVNIDDIHENEIPFYQPFLTLDNDKALIKQLQKQFTDIPAKELQTAILAGLAELEQCKADIRAEGERTLKYIRLHNIKGVVLAGHPYHIDEEVHHGIPQLVTMHGMAVFTEDSIAHLGEEMDPLRVVDQWKYHARLYRAATFTAKQNDLEFVQLTSFGCGLDAITTDMCQEIIEGHNKIYTLIKIDEISNLGAARIRIRSLKAAMDEREKNDIRSKQIIFPTERALFTKEMQKSGEYTILMPQLAPTQFRLLSSAAKSFGFNIELLPNVSLRTLDEGTRYVNNDACYPAIVAIGQLVEAVKHGDYDTNKIAVLMSQTGGGCRATNYVALIKKAFNEAGYGHVPVISFNTGGMEPHPGFKLPIAGYLRLLIGLIIGDVLDRMLYRMRPYELVPGSANKLYESLLERGQVLLQNFSFSAYKKYLAEAVKTFDALPINNERKPRVGVVGEILVKFHPGANNNIVDIIEAEGGEAVVPDFTDFILYCCYDDHFKTNTFNKYKITSFVKESVVVPLVYHYRKPASDALKKSRHFAPPADIEVVAEKASELLSLGNQMGEGWFLTGEMLELLDEDVPNIACLQPFACLPNHITGRGMIKAIKERNPEANIMAIDYDTGISSVNQLNRIKLLLAVAHKKENLKKQLDKKI